MASLLNSSRSIAQLSIVRSDFRYLGGQRGRECRMVYSNQFSAKRVGVQFDLTQPGTIGGEGTLAQRRVYRRSPRNSQPRDALHVVQGDHLPVAGHDLAERLVHRGRKGES